LSKSKNKIPTKKQLLSLLKKYNYVKQHVADTQGVDEKTVRRWCKHHGIDVDFERKKYILEYEFTNVLPKDVAKKSPLNDDNTRVLPGSDTEEMTDELRRGINTYRFRPRESDADWFALTEVKKFKGRV